MGEGKRREGGDHGSNTTDCFYSYLDFIDFLDQMFICLLYTLRTISRDLKFFFLKKSFTNHAHFTREWVLAYATKPEVILMYGF